MTSKKGLISVRSLLILGVLLAGFAVPQFAYADCETDVSPPSSTVLRHITVHTSGPEPVVDFTYGNGELHHVRTLDPMPEATDFVFGPGVEFLHARMERKHARMERKHARILSRECALGGHIEPPGKPRVLGKGAVEPIK
jgi:hypothetical protein